MLKQVFEQAIRWKKLSGIPVVNAVSPAIKKVEMKIWSPQEIITFLQYCKGEYHRITFLLAI